VGGTILQNKMIYNRENELEMNAQNNNRTKWMHLRLKPEEYNQIHQYFSKSTCWNMSEYSRKVLLNKPVVVTHRNNSLDDYMTEAIRLKNELNNIGNNFNQAVKRLHTLHQIQEFKRWIITYEKDKLNLLNKVEEIKVHMQKIAEKWLQ
jgi:hypothetical protein